MEFLYWLEKMRVPILNEIMLLIIEFGNELTFFVVAFILFWCVDKKKGYFVMLVGFFGTIANQFMKLWFRIPRPWVLDPDFTILEPARKGASGYSFPSGHTQNSVGTFGALLLTCQTKWVRIISAVLMILVPFSRMYVGVHTPKDVLTAALMTMILLWILYPAAVRFQTRLMPPALACMAAAAIGFVIFVNRYSFPPDIDQSNLASGIKNAYILLGTAVGFIIVFVTDEKWLDFPVSAIWWAQILKVVLGLVLVLLVKTGLKAPLDSLLSGHMFSVSIRYFLVVITAGIIWPLTFRWFSRLGQPDKHPAEI